LTQPLLQSDWQLCAVAEMLTVSGRRLLLRDDDCSSVTQGKNDRRLNTLAHYRVPDGCTLAVVTRYSATTRSNGQHYTISRRTNRLVVHFVITRQCSRLLADMGYGSFY